MDNYVQVVSPTTTLVILTCSLNITIPSTAVVIWIHNNTILFGANKVLTNGNTTTLLIENFQPSDTGTYRCEFNDFAGSGWTLSRNIEVYINGMG